MSRDVSAEEAIELLDGWCGRDVELRRASSAYVERPIRGKLLATDRGGHYRVGEAEFDSGPIEAVYVVIETDDELPPSHVVERVTSRLLLIRGKTERDTPFDSSVQLLEP